MRDVIKSFFLQNDSLKPSILIETRTEREGEREFTDQGKKANPKRQARGNDQSEETQNRQRYKRKLRD